MEFAAIYAFLCGTPRAAAPGVACSPGRRLLVQRRAARRPRFRRRPAV
ncbi:hypothetical protein BMA10247_0716 [Burkholderia mallei NCTC 10247]|nr:hypothetical protein BMASAVP1_A1434 [Burkholderia mallei SAVP1]ABO06745.1 hypothetical protein BMA10247_0716 [Burkholderia mallei NCTC 10247]EEP87276.1 conserved hypothetical protein [Burkholderia mallei GB8 horse 4]